VWTVYEQVLMASLDIGSINQADHCFQKLDMQFPNSRRVMRLLGMIKEADKDFAGALEVYDALLEEQPADEHARKRKVCTLKAQNKLVEAANELARYLEDFQADIFAWKELCDMYLKLNEHEKAKFCIEEVLMSEPQNHAWACLHAEVCYTLGTPEDLRVARKYYALSLQLKPNNNARALYGLVATTSAISTAKGSRPATDPENGKLFKVASTKLLSQYLDRNPKQASHVQQLLADIAPQ